MSATDILRFFASAPRGVEPLLASELENLGAGNIRETAGGVHFSGELRVAYRACLWSRLASRVLMPLVTAPIGDADALYAAAREIDWPDLFDAERSFAVEVAGRSPVVPHTHFASLRVKDAIADRFRRQLGRRPDVDTESPDLQVHLHLHGEQATLSLDFAGAALHQRGYRPRSGAAAPLKENLAAAILLRAGWPEIAAAGGGLLDPLCGSGTLVLEAALIAGDVAPGLLRSRWGFSAWNEHRPKLWRDLVEEAEARRLQGRSRIPLLRGQDLDAGALRLARESAQRLGLPEQVQWHQADLAEARPPATAPGLVVANPPYGERLGAEAEVVKIHSLLGSTLRTHFPGWRAAVFTGRPDLGERIGLRAEKLYSLYNGPLLCKLLILPVPVTPSGPAPLEGDFANRIRKNLAHLGKWARRSGVSCYRLYDADLKEYALAVDVYESSARHVVVQEYAAPKTVDPVRAEKRLREALAALQALLEVPAARLHYRLRKPQRGSAQYEKQGEAGRRHIVEEHGCRLAVNFEEYLDTGLFLDHRPLRRRIQEEAKGRRFLNLFCYTGAATAHALRGGARETVSVDLSHTYLEWAAENLRLNGANAVLLDRPGPPPWPAHALLRADCLTWLEAQAGSRGPPQFDMILLDPPTFSNSKRMEDTLDVQRDHVGLIRRCVTLLAAGGVLYFSTNRRGFKLDQAALQDLHCEDITARTLDEDFRRPPPPHRCWRIQRAAAVA